MIRFVEDARCSGKLALSFSLRLDDVPEASPRWDRVAAA
jgi:hypothetical protein